MNVNKKKILSLILIVMMILSPFSGCGSSKDETATEESGADESITPFEYSDRDGDASYDEVGATKINLNEGSAAIDGSGAKADGGTVTVSESGTYIVSGILNDGQIIVDADETDKVQLVLNGCEITSLNSAAIYIKQADKVFITLAEGTQNTLTDATVYDMASGEDEPDAALFSKDDLSVNGSGALTVNANYNHGIHGKDDVIICGGNISINSVNDGIKGKDVVAVKDADINITAGGDGIQSNNDTDTSLGRVYIDGGNIDITAAQDGIQAQTALSVSDGNIKITSGGGSANASYKTDNFGWGAWGGENNSDEVSDSAKGLKSETLTVLSGGSITIDSSDDAVHSNGSVIVNGAEIVISSGDDGIHADSTTELSSGSVRITASYEGIEGNVITASGADIEVFAYDDGFNAAGGNDGSGTNRPGADNFAADESCNITISGGKIVISAAGDGIDSNGSLTVSGGTTYVWGPTDNANGPLDYAGEAIITGGIFVAAGSSGMAQGFSESATQYSFLAALDAYAGGSEVNILDESGNVLLTFTPVKNFSSLVVSIPEFEKNKTYTVESDGGLSIQITLDAVNTTYGNAGSGGFPGGNFPQGDFTQPEGSKPDGMTDQPGQTPPSGERP